MLTDTFHPESIGKLQYIIETMTDPATNTANPICRKQTFLSPAEQEQSGITPPLPIPLTA